MHTHLIFVLKLALHLSKLAMKLLTVVQSCFTHNCKLNTMNQSTSMLRHAYGTPTFKINTLHLVSNEGQIKHL